MYKLKEEGNVNLRIKKLIIDFIISEWNIIFDIINTIYDFFIISQLICEICLFYQVSRSLPITYARNTVTRIFVSGWRWMTWDVARSRRFRPKCAIYTSELWSIIFSFLSMLYRAEGQLVPALAHPSHSCSH